MQSPPVESGRWAALAVLCLSLVVIALDGTIVNVAIPTIATKLHGSESQLQWIVDGYTLAFATLLLAAGHVADRVGRQKMLMVGLGLFGVASMMATFSTSVAQLIVFRVLMGVGGACIMPSTLSTIAHLFRDAHERARALSLWSATLGIGAVLGPVLGGRLLQSFNWESVFWINVPIAAVAIGLAWRRVPNSRHPSGRADPVGLAYSAVGLTALVWSIIEGPTKGWGSGAILGGFAVAAVSLAVFVWWERRQLHPLLPLHFFASRRFTMATVSLGAAYFGLIGALFLSTQYLQSAMGDGPFLTGLRLLPEALAIAALSVASHGAALRFGTKHVAAVGLLLSALGLWLLSHLHPGSAYTQMWPGLVLLGAGLGTTMAPCEDSVIGSLPQSQTGVGSSVNSTIIQVGTALGVAVFGSVENTAYQHHMNHAAARLAAAHLPQSLLAPLAQSLSVARALVSHLPPVLQGPLFLLMRTAFDQGLDRALALGSAVSVAAALAAWVYLPARADPGTLSSPDPS